MRRCDSYSERSVVVGANTAFLNLSQQFFSSSVTLRLSSLGSESVIRIFVLIRIRSISDYTQKTSERFFI